MTYDKLDKQVVVYRVSLQQSAEKNSDYPSQCTWRTSDELPALLLSLLLGLLWQRTNIIIIRT